MNDKPGLTITITDHRICEALRQHNRDTVNTVTNERESLDDTVEAILYYFLIGANRTS